MAVGGHIIHTRKCMIVPYVARGIQVGFYQFIAMRLDRVTPI